MINIQVSEMAKAKMKELIENDGREILGIRIFVDARSPLNPEFNMGFVLADEDVSGDAVLKLDEFNIYVDMDSLKFVDGITLNYKEDLMGGSFSIENPPKVRPELKGPLAEKVQKLIEEQINPALAMHGGHVALIDVKEERVYIELGGGCKGCGMVDVTLKQGIEVMIKQAVPEVKEILDVTDHASGTNPYYQPSK